MRTPKATHANFEGTQRGYRVTIMAGDKEIASTHFTAAFDKDTFTRDHAGAYAAAKKYAAGYGVA